MAFALLAAALLLSMFVSAGVALWLRDRFVSRRSSIAAEAERHEYHARLLHPSWEAVAANFGGVVPPPVAALYRDTDLLLSWRLELRDDVEIECFVPADKQAFESGRWFNPAPDAFVFATSALGDPFFVRTSEVNVGLPVRVLYHDGGEVELVSPTMNGLLERLAKRAV